MKDRLDLSDFTYAAPTAGVKSKMLEYEVPLNSYVRLFNDVPMSLKIPTTETVNTYSTTPAATSNVTVTLPDEVATVSDALGTISNLQVSAIAYWTTASGTTLIYPTAITGNQVTFALNDTANTGTLKVIYLGDAGTYQWTIVAPEAGGTSSKNVANAPIGGVNYLDQANAATPLYFPTDWVLPQRWKIQLWIQAPTVIDMDYSSFTTATPNILARLRIPIAAGTMKALMAADPDAMKHAMQQIHPNLVG